jgi:hypothetical protein
MAQRRGESSLARLVLSGQREHINFSNEHVMLRAYGGRVLEDR